MNNPHQKALVKLLTQQNHRHSMYTVFSDFVELAALEREASMMAPGRDRVWVAEERR